MLAATLVYLGPKQIANRILAFVLTARGIAFVCAAMAQAGTTAVDRALWDALFPYGMMALGVSAWAFAAVHPRPRLQILSARSVPVVLLVVVGVLDGAYLLDHDLWVGADGSLGALARLTTYIFISFPVAAALFLRDGLRMPPGRLRTSLFLMSMGFSLVQLNDVVGALISVARTGSSSWTDGVYTTAPLVVTLVFHLLVVAQLVVAATRRGRAGDRIIGAYLGLVGLSAASGAVVGFTDVAVLERLLEAVWNSALPLLVTYALLKRQLFDIDLRVKWTIRQSTVAAAFIGVFFIVSEGAAQIFEAQTGSATAGILAAGALVFAIAPLQRMAERVANTAMPNVKAPADLTAGERAKVYLDQARAAWRDGAIDRSERALLDTLRESLGLPLAEAVALERQASEEGD